MEENKEFNASEYKMKYAKEHYKRIPLDVTIKMLEEINQHIEITGEKRNTFIKRAITECIENDRKK